MLAIVLLCTACSSKSPSPPADRSPSPSSSPSAFVNGGDCPGAADPALPEDAGCTSVVIAGEATFTVYGLLNDEARPKAWRMRLTTPDDDIDQVLRAGNDFSYPRVVGAADIDSDGSTEWWVRVVDYTSHGAPWSGLNVFFTGEDELVPLSLEGKPFMINYGGIARLGEGATCNEGALSLLRAEAANRINTRWTVSGRNYELEGTNARLVARDEGTLTITDYNDPDLDPYYRVDCNGFVFPS